MTQKGLIQKILNTANMNDCNPNSVPTTQNTLGADEDGKPTTETWNYRAIVGMLLYLSTTREATSRWRSRWWLTHACRYNG
jgi:hypothetical protein